MPERIGHYKIISKLGRGGMGVVYKAHEESLNRYVAIKVLGEHLVEDDVFLSRFIREAQSAASLSHPNIVPIYYIGEDDGTNYFVMEYVSGKPVDALLEENGKLDSKVAARIVLDAANGLAAAHDQGVIHRDIKPANLMLDSRGTVKIADFGLALPSKTDAKLTATGMLMGTPGYLAPEQCRGEQADHRTDIYALGVTLYEMLTGQAPFKSESPILLIRQILDEDPPPVIEFNPEADEEIRRILGRMTNKERSARYQSAHELIDDLEGYLSGESQRTIRSAIAGMVGTAESSPEPTVNLGSGAATMVTGDQKRTAATVAEGAVPTAVTAAGEPLPPPPPPPGSADLRETEVVAVTEPNVDRSSSGSSSMWPLALFVILLLVAGGAAAWFMTRSDDDGDDLEIAAAGESSVDGIEGAVGDTALETLPPPDETGLRGTREETPELVEDPADPAEATPGPAAQSPSREGSRSTSQSGSGVAGETPRKQVAQTSAVAQQPAASPSLKGTAIVTLGDQQLAPEVSALLTDKLGRGDRVVHDAATLPEMSSLVRGNPDVGRLLSAARNAGVRNLLVVDITPTGERELNYMGRSQTAYSSRVSLTVYDVETGRPSGRSSEPIEYTTLNREREAEKITRKLVLAITKNLR